MPKDTNKQKNNNVKKNNKKENKTFFRNFKAELKKVIWLTPKQLVNNTVAVLTIVLITAVIVAVLDMVFKTVNDVGTRTIRAVVENYKDNTQSIEGEESANSEEETVNSEETSANSEGESSAEISEEGKTVEENNEAVAE